MTAYGGLLPFIGHLPPQVSSRYSRTKACCFLVSSFMARLDRADDLGLRQWSGQRDELGRTPSLKRTRMGRVGHAG